MTHPEYMLYDIKFEYIKVFEDEQVTDYENEFHNIKCFKR